MEKIRLENIYAAQGWDKVKEFYETLVEKPGFRVEKIMSAGHTAPVDGWFDQNENEMVILLQGNAVIEYENDQQIEMAPGDILTIRTHQRHKVTYTSTEPHCTWIAVFWS